MTKLLLTAVAVGLILTGSIAAQAQPLCLPAFEGSQGSEPYRFAYRAIESLSIAKEADAATDATKMTNFPMMLLAFNRAAAGYDCAARIGSALASSNDDVIKKASKLAHTLYGAQAGLHRAMAETVAKAMDASEMGSVANAFARLTVEVNQVHKETTHLGVMVTFALVDSQRVEDNRLPYLRITGRERDALIALLRRQFGPEVEGGMAGKHALVATAAMLHEWLSKEGYRPSDWRR